MKPSTPGQTTGRSKRETQHFAGSFSSEAKGKIMSSCGGFKAILSNSLAAANGTTFYRRERATGVGLREIREVVLRSREGL